VVQVRGAGRAAPLLRKRAALLHAPAQLPGRSPRAQHPGPPPTPGHHHPRRPSPSPFPSPAVGARGPADRAVRPPQPEHPDRQRRQPAPHRQPAGAGLRLQVRLRLCVPAHLAKVGDHAHG
jgi:hypothetical protein